MGPPIKGLSYLKYYFDEMCMMMLFDFKDLDVKYTVSIVRHERTLI